MKIHIIGSSGSGKSYFAEKLSKKFNIPHYYLDDIEWKRKYDIENELETKEKLLKAGCTDILELIQSNSSEDKIF